MHCCTRTMSLVHSEVQRGYRWDIHLCFECNKCILMKWEVGANGWQKIITKIFVNGKPHDEEYQVNNVQQEVQKEVKGEK